MKFINDAEKENIIISVSQIIKIEYALECLQSRKITIDSSDTEYNDKIKLLKKANPSVFELTSLIGKTSHTAKMGRQYINNHFKDVMIDRIFNLKQGLDLTKRNKKGQDLVEIYRSRL